MIKTIASGKEAQKKLFKGVKMLADSVVVTLGPKGRNVAIQRPWGVPIVVHDGVTVAREVESQDALVDIGIDLIKDAASKTNEEAGDGTTTATLLAYELVKRGMDLLNEGVNPMVLRNQIYAVLPNLLAELKKLSKPVKSNEDVRKVAVISSANEEIGKLVAEAVEKVGEDGLVTVEEGGIETEVEFTEGLEFDKGYLSHYFVTNPQRMEAVIEEPYIVLLNKDISLNTEIVPIVEEAVKASKNLFIIAKDLKGDALATLVANKMKGNINVVVVNAPKSGNEAEEYYNDIAVLTGGKVLSDETGVDITQNSDWLGRANKVLVSKDTTVIIGGKGNKKEIDNRLAQLKNQIKNEKSKFEKEKLEERVARMSTGIGVIKVGAKTEIDMRERVERVKDAVGSATSAREEGIIPGGGSVFLQMSKVLEGKTEGEKLLKEVLEAPARKLMSNSGETNEVINSRVDKILKSEAKEALGYEVDGGKLVNLIDMGVIDPTKVVRLALENAIAVSSSILTTETIISSELEEFEKKRGA